MPTTMRTSAEPTIKPLVAIPWKEVKKDVYR